uniref:Si:ch211-133n4.7 n=1 Tax=Cyprinus carpio TaxID=7962 RepID=A0A8C2KS67_CYPCA
MDSVYYNGFMPPATTSDCSCTQHRGNSIQKQEVTSPKWTKVLLIILSVSLVFALGGLCVLGIMYFSVSVQLSAQKTMHYTSELNINYFIFKRPSFTAQTLNCTTNFHGKLYFFSSNVLNWSSSRAFCVSKGADLVTITSQTEQDFLASEIEEQHWIGLTDLKTEGHWVWVNNQTLTDTGVQSWYKRASGQSEPDNWRGTDPSGEHCAVVRYFEGHVHWFDVSCKLQKKFICEKKY